MLSFMREQESPKASDRSAGPDSQHVPAGESPEAQEYLTVAANSKNLRRSTMLVAILVAIGLLCLLVMIRRSQPQAASATEAKGDQTKIEAAISRLTGVRSEMVGRADEIVKKFYEFSDVFQVKVSELNKNPFEVEGGVKTEKQNTMVTEDPQLRAQLLRNQRLQQQVSTLKLLCITQPGQNSSQDFYCVINDQQLRQGDKVEDFTVRRIGSNSVDLVWSGPKGPGSGSETEDIKITLKLSQ